MHDDKRPGLGGGWALWSISHKLIAINVAVFLVGAFAPGLIASQFTVSYAGVFEHAKVWTLLTAAFAHLGPWHLLWNMLFLHWFGPDLEQIYGRRNFLVLYLYAALVGSLAHVVYSHHWGFDVPALGASGAVMGVVLVTATFYPQRTILLFFVLPIPLWALAGFKLLGDIAGIMGPGGGVSNAGHLGGAAAGLTFKLLDLRLFPSPGESDRGWRWPWQRAARPRAARRVQPSISGRQARQAPNPLRDSAVDVETASRVDDLLRKINEEGIDSLSEEELTYLKEASSRYKRPASGRGG